LLPREIWIGIHRVKQKTGEVSAGSRIAAVEDVGGPVKGESIAA